MSEVLWNKSNGIGRSLTAESLNALPSPNCESPPGLPPLHTSTPVWEELILTPHPLLLDAWGNLLRKVCMPAKMSRVSACSAPTDFSFVCEDFGEENCRLWRKMQQLFSPQAPPFPSSPLSLPPAVPSPKFKTKLNPGNRRLQYSYAENMPDESKS